MLQITPKLLKSALMIVLIIIAAVGVPLAYYLVAPVIDLPRTLSSGSALGVATAVALNLAVRRVGRNPNSTNKGGAHVGTK